MNSNNFLSNVEPRLPSRITSCLSEAIAGIELQAARVAKGAVGETEIEQQLGQLLRIVETNTPEKTAQVKARMVQPLSLVDRHPRFRAYRGQSGSLDMIRSVDIGQRYRPALGELATNWVHIPPEVAGAHLEGRLAERLAVRVGRDDILLPQRPYSGLRFYLAQVKAIDETGSGWGEWGEDEIYCGAVAVDENGESSSAGLFHVGDFDDGDVKSFGYPGKLLQYFYLREGGDTFPKIYNIAVSLVEHDYGDLPEWFDRFLEAVKDKVTEILATAVGVAIGSSLGPLGALIGAAIGWAVGKVIGLIKSWIGDENLGTKTLSATINSYGGNWVGSGGSMSDLYTRDYVAHSGHYRLWWRCELVG